ncbi:hypothetical protein JCM15754A_21830 [Prevotella aurantiaca JCM 15754]
MATEKLDFNSYINRYAYDEHSSSEDLPYKFNGKQFDAETGLYYNRFRYYDPNAGSYISQDPIGLKGGNIKVKQIHH